MTLLDLCRLLRRYIALVIALPVVLAAACMGYLAFSSGDAPTSAVANIVVSTHLQDVHGLAAAQGRAYAEANEDIEVDTNIDSNKRTVIITVTSTDLDRSKAIADEIAEKVLDEAFAFVPDNADDPFNARAESAQEKVDTSGSGGMLKYVLAAILAGLFLAICIVIIIDLVKRPIKSVEGVQNAAKLPVLEVLPVSDGGERLLANIRFATKEDDIKSVCLVSLDDDSAANAAAEKLLAAANAESPEKTIDVKCYEGLSKCIKAAYGAREADATVLVVSQWKDSLADLESAVAELELANANLVGIVYSKA